MKKTSSKIVSILLSFVMLLTLCVSAGASDLPGYIKLNGSADSFTGTLAEAITAAGAGGTVDIYGTVFTNPIGTGEYAGTVITDITIQGKTEDAAISIHPLFVDLNDSKFDVLTVKGSDVLIKDLTVDALYRVDFPIRIFGGSSDVTLENVVAKHGTRGSVNILASDKISFINVQANESNQGGFYFDCAYDCTNVSFTNCSTSKNSRTGVLIRNGYGPSTNIDLSGITCFENTFAVEDRMQGTIGGGEAAEIQIIAPPKDTDGKAIETARAMFFIIEKQYQHIRYGVTENDVLDAMASIDADRYGFETTIYYKSVDAAESDVREGETIVKYSIFKVIYNRIMKFIYIIIDAINGFTGKK